MAKCQVKYDNLTKAQERSFSLIQGLGIYELRALARVFGDTCPTTSKRDNHIKFIMDKIIEGSDLQPIPVHQGRPYKELSHIRSILDSLSVINNKNYSQTVFDDYDEYGNEENIKVIGFKQVEPEVLKKKLFPIKVRGIVNSQKINEYYVINEENAMPIFIDKNSYAQLEKYDYVEGTAVVMNDNNEYILDDIDTINFVDFNTYSPSVVENSQILPSQKINIDAKEIIFGKRYRLSQAKFSDNVEDLKKLVKALQKKNIVCVALAGNTTYEEQLAISSIGFDNLMLIKFEDSPSEYYQKATSFVNNVKRLQEIGTSVAVFVQDIVTISYSLDTHFKCNDKIFLNHCEETTNLVKNLVMLAKATETCTTTLFVTCDTPDLNDALFVSTCYKVTEKI